MKAMIHLIRIRATHFYFQSALCEAILRTGPSIKRDLARQLYAKAKSDGATYAARVARIRGQEGPGRTDGAIPQ